MATARETLFHEMMALTSGAPGDDAADAVQRIMLRYRVQTKPGTEIGEAPTARDALGARLLAIWRASPADREARIGAEVDSFRMQSKAGPGEGTPSTPRAPKPRAEKPEKAPPARPAAVPMPIAELAPLPPARPVAVAGGPKRRGKTRSECPKCHSMGVVLAQSYAGDEYYSCIYCGWQAYKPVDENDPTSSLAGRLLGTTAGNE